MNIVTVVLASAVIVSVFSSVLIAEAARIKLATAQQHQRNNLLNLPDGSPSIGPSSARNVIRFGRANLMVGTNLASSQGKPMNLDSPTVYFGNNIFGGNVNVTGNNILIGNNLFSDEPIPAAKETVEKLLQPVDFRVLQESVGDALLALDSLLPSLLVYLRAMDPIAANAASPAMAVNP